MVLVTMKTRALRRTEMRAVPVKMQKKMVGVGVKTRVKTGEVEARIGIPGVLVKNARKVLVEVETARRVGAEVGAGLVKTGTEAAVETVSVAQGVAVEVTDIARKAVAAVETAEAEAVHDGSGREGVVVEQSREIRKVGVEVVAKHIKRKIAEAEVDPSKRWTGGVAAEVANEVGAEVDDAQIDGKVAAVREV